MDLIELFDMFPDEASAEAKFAEMRWPAGMACPRCGSVNVQTGASHKTMPYRCRDCRKRFSVRTGTVMEASNIGYRKWAIAIYVLTTSNKGVSSRRLAAMLGITQKSAWHLAHRIREAWVQNQLPAPFEGPVEADETWVGGRDRNRHLAKRLRQSWRLGRVPVVGVRDRASGRVAAKVVPGTGARQLQPFVMEHTTPDTVVYTDEWHSYRGLRRRHRMVNHSMGQYVDGDAHTNGIESFWAMIKRSYVGTYHHLPGKHLHRYVAEFVGRHNARGISVEEQMRRIVLGFTIRLRYADLVA